MIKKLTLHRFKQFKDSQLELIHGVTFLVGGNNSGKSSVLHALAVWEFCRTILEMEKGRNVFVAGASGQGVGIGDDEFSPINVPSLRHLWTNLKTQKEGEQDGYTLRVGAYWDDDDDKEWFLEFGMALANDRLFIKATNSSISNVEVHIPKLAYLPPFAGITDRETRLTPAMRNRLIGQGLSGGVIRNVMYDMYLENQRKRRELRGNRSKLKASDLASLRQTDPWELLGNALQDLFSVGLNVRPFNEHYHTHIVIEAYRGKITKARFKKVAGYSPRDLMVEGSGFLQWLSVYALALTPEIDVILLDEPDAHLHCSLQLELIFRLEALSAQAGKQVLLATHSSEIIRSSPAAQVLQIVAGGAKYLSNDAQKIGVLAGIGTEYSPRLHKLQERKRLLLVEGEFDERLLQIWAEKLGLRLPANLVVWHWASGHKQRKQLFSQLKEEIPDLKAISIRDRDDEPDGTVDADLKDKTHTSNPPGFLAMKWRRRHIENYLIQPNAVARAAGKTVEEVSQFFRHQHGLAPPNDVIRSDVVQPIRDAYGKAITTQGKGCIQACFGISREDIAKAMEADEVAEDVRTFIREVQKLCGDSNPG